MKKNKIKSQVSLGTKTDIIDDIPDNPLDVLYIKILGLNIPDENSIKFNIKASLFDQLLICDTIISTNSKLTTGMGYVRGEMYYDPSDYEKMGRFADTPITVSIQPIQPQQHQRRDLINNDTDAYFCNIDMIKVFTDTDVLVIEKRMETMTRSIKRAKSWKTLPLISIEINIHRNTENYQHHDILRYANLMKITLVGCYNMKLPFDETFSYTSATKLPICNQKGSSTVMFNKGEKVPERFDHTSFLPQWECLRNDESNFTKDDEKLSCNLEDIYNEENIDLNYYTNKLSDNNTTIWASFHRTLIVKSLEEWLSNHLLQYKWPLEVHMYRDTVGYSLMACIDLLKLLYPGENTVRIAVPLQWMSTGIMMENCGYEYLLLPNEKAFGVGSTTKTTKATTESIITSDSTTTTCTVKPTGSDGNNAFVLVEVKLTRPLKEPCIPPHIISNHELMEMLLNAELSKQKDVVCRGRTHQDNHWQETVRKAANLLRTVPHYGLSDLGTFIRHLNLTKTRVELETSFWQEAAHYVNNNFVINEFIKSDDRLEELIMMAHVSLMHVTEETLLGPAAIQESKHAFRAARQARQTQDIPHAIDLYLQTLVQQKRNPDAWRELSTCYKDKDKHLANVCLDKAIKLGPRHPLSLLSKACLVMDKESEDAEPFFIALLGLYPFCMPLWVAASAYYFYRELYDISEELMAYIKRTMSQCVSYQLMYPRTWNYELGDWWDQTPMLPGCSIYYDAADLLLRIRGISLAEVCLAQSLAKDGETPMYYHLLALCCRLRGDVDSALCHLQQAKEKFPGISYLKSLEAECHYKKGNWTDARTCFDESVNFSGPYNTLLSLSPSLPRSERQNTHSIIMDLLRRQPSAYSWMTFAETWMRMIGVGGGGDASKADAQDSPTRHTIACAEQALKYDRCCGYAWAILSKIGQPRAKRLYCHTMASLCGYRFKEEEHEDDSESEQSLCYHVADAIQECQCRFQEDN